MRPDQDTRRVTIAGNGRAEGRASRRARSTCPICLPQAPAALESLHVPPRAQERVRSASPQPEPQGPSAQRSPNSHPPLRPICQGLSRSEMDSVLAVCTDGPAPPAITSRYRPAPLRTAVTPQSAEPLLERELAPPLESSWSWRLTRSSLIFLSRLLLLDLSTNPLHAPTQHRFGTVAVPPSMNPSLRRLNPRSRATRETPLPLKPA
jgi:hypothetical protein